MSKTLILDCDGVVLDSNEMKCQAFAQILSSYDPSAVGPFLAFQRGAFGSSRYKLLDQFFSDYLGRDPYPGEREHLLSAFSTTCKNLYPLQSFTHGALYTLSKLVAAGVTLYIVSGSDQEELRTVFDQLEITQYFYSIFGSPNTKIENLNRIIAASSGRSSMIFVGDAAADMLAAEACGVPFVYMSGYAADPQGMEVLRKERGFPLIKDLTELRLFYDFEMA